MKIRRTLGVLLTGAVCVPIMLAAQAGALGQRIQAKPGDLILVENADRVPVIRRREAHLRAVHNSQQRWLVVLVDYALAGAEPDGQVDACVQVRGDHRRLAAR